MSEEVPQLYPSGTEIYQYAQAALAIGQLSSAIRRRWVQRREQAGRLAQAEDEHAARMQEARAHPAVREMTEAEQQEWTARLRPDLLSERHDQDFAAWTARLDEEWGVEAHTWDTGTGAPTGSVRLVCRDADDAAELCRWLYDHHEPADLDSLRTLAANAAGGYSVEEPEQTGGLQVGDEAAPPVLSEADWAAALRSAMPAKWVDKIVVTDPSHPHHSAWRELHALANEEVWRVGADPHVLAGLVRDVPTWRDTIKKPPAMAYWAIAESRSAPGYEDVVRGQPRTPATATDPTSDTTPLVVEGEVVAGPARRRLAQVHTPQQAVQWARGLEAGDPEHRIEAKLGLGRWGSQVDEELARKFPTLMSKTNAAVERDRRRAERNAADAPAATVVAGAADLDPDDLQKHLDYVATLDPAKSGDQLAARTMLGHVSPEVDRALADRFGDDPRFADKLVTLYPDGLPDDEAAALRRHTGAGRAAATRSRRDPVDDVRAAAVAHWASRIVDDLGIDIGAGASESEPTPAEEAAWRSRADASAGRAAAIRSVADDPATPVDERQQATPAANRVQRTADAEHSIAATTAATAPAATTARPEGDRPRTR